MLRRPTGRPFTWDGNAMFHGTSGQITVQQVEILIERITLGAKICRTRSLGCPASFVLHKRLNESENHLQPPAGDFCAVEESLSDSLQPAQRGKACLGFAALGPLGAATIWYCLMPGQACIQPGSQGASQKLRTLLVCREETQHTGPPG